MENIIKKATTYLIILVSLIITACSKQEDMFVFRNTDALSFNYAAEVQELTVRTNGAWTVSSEADWINVSPSEGVGNGEQVEVVQVEVSRNSGDAREGSVLIDAAGQTLVVAIDQEDGMMILEDARLEGTFNMGETLVDCYIVIPFQRGMINEEITATVNVEGEAASGIDPVIDFLTVVEAETGEIRIPLQGQPVNFGEIGFVITLSTGFTSTVLGSVSDGSADPIGTVYFEERFDKMLWGGDYVGSQPGIRGGFTDGVIDETQPITEVGDGTDGSNDLINTMAESYRELRGFVGWDGLRIYERPGYIKISTAASRDGHIITPAFSEIPNQTNLKVTVDLARWSSASSRIYIEVHHAGETSVEHLFVDNIRSWASYEFFIQNATSETKLVFKADPDQEGRFFVDNIIVEKAN